LDKGVDGFNIIGAEYLLESNNTSAGESVSGVAGAASVSVQH